MLDLDDFKRINDSRGHAAGDRALVRAASMVAASLRDVDVCARYGGEEFALIIPETGHEGAYIVAERIRQRVERDFTRLRGPRVTVSGGVATFPEESRRMLDDAPEGPLRGVPVVIKDEWPLPWRAETVAAARVPGVSFEPGESGPYRALRDAGAVIAGVASAVVGADGVVDIPPIMGGEDFSAYLARTPGAFVLVGSRSEGAGSTYPHHHPRFTVDEQALPIGVAVLVRSALALLEHPPSEGG